ncbi:hypothetical protein AGMMS49965_01990 [Bacteroidia bacterium]|nr:hypothetical protein AGMMS49965_01990 [Bacteroidia bacterium]
MTYSFVLSIAASIAVLVLAGVRFFTPSVEADNQLVEKRMADEFLTTDHFYRGQMDRQIADIQCKLDNTDSPARAQLERDLQSLLDENTRFVEKIQTGENEELELFYLVKHYKTNLRALQFINEKLGKYVEC